ncbi:MAG: Sir2 family NAD+-dependent deacetylase [Pseudomonadota bacterium]
MSIELEIGLTNNLSVVVLTGAGISAESGLKTFRDNDGLWENHRVEEVATPEAFHANPELVYRFYNLRRRQLLSDDVKPNPAHTALAALEKMLGDNFLLVTQNVDNLHERAGNKNILHMHGELTSVKCVKTGAAFQTQNDIDMASECECCPGNKLRPDIVWFGEIPYHMDVIEEHLAKADIFVSVGTSGNVYPAAGFVQFAKRCGAYCVELNLEPSNGSYIFDRAYHGKATDVVTQFVDAFSNELP